MASLLAAGGTVSARARAAANATPPRPRRKRPPLGVWVMVGVPLVLLAVLLWQVGSAVMRSDIVGRTAVAASRATLEEDPAGARIDLVLVDRFGNDVAANADLTISLREPDGALWQTSRSLSSADFAALAGHGLLGGRLGYALVVPTADWARVPRRGGAATVVVTVHSRDGGQTFSTVSEERFP
jgi:hypothetical protein